jgi:hypothetical protein
MRSVESLHRMKESTEPRLRLKGHGLFRGAIWHPWPKRVDDARRPMPSGLVVAAQHCIPLAFALLFASFVMAAESRPPLRGGVEKSDRDRGQGEGYCERYGASINPFEGRLQVMPKAGQGNRDFCLAPRPNWTLLGEDRNHCCFFAPRDWVVKVPPLPGKVQKEQPPPDRRPAPPSPACRNNPLSYTCLYGHADVIPGPGPVPGPGGSGPGGPSPVPGQNTGACQDIYKEKVEQINTSFIEHAKGCGDTVCIAQAVNAKAAQTQEAEEKLDECQNETGQKTGCDSTTLVKGEIKDEWDGYNRKLADAISDEFQKHTDKFRSQNGGERVPLKVTIQYYVQGPPAPPTQYMNKTLDYGIYISSVTPEAIPWGHYNMLKTLLTDFTNVAQQSLYATMASYQSRLKFPEGAKCPNGRYEKTGSFSNDLTAPKLKYDEAPTRRY